MLKFFQSVDPEPCAGCKKIATLFEVRVAKHRQLGYFPPALKTTIVHPTYLELDSCARKGCPSCRIFRQALLLKQVTTSEAEGLMKVRDPICVRLLSKPDPVLRVCIGDAKDDPARTAIVSCRPNYVVDPRILSESPHEPEIYQLAKQWLADCYINHRAECGRGWSSKNPTRLLRILSSSDSETKVQLVRSHGEKNKYVALSYCWGPDSPELREGKTTAKNIQSRMQGFDCSKFPATIRDTIALTKLLGIEYIWIDSVCIIQEGDDGKDLNQEAPKMNEVYGNAHLTICVCSSDRAVERMLDTRAAWSCRIRACKLSNQYISAVDMSLNEMRARSPLSSRGWTLQEERLSPRILYWTCQRMYWSCARSQRIEMHEHQTPGRRLQDESPADGSLAPPQGFLSSCWEGRVDPLHTDWLDVVKSYCRRSLSYKSDRYRAISGLAARYRYAQKGDQYLAGLWRKSFAQDLSWSVAFGQATDESRSLRGTVAIPSWSWASLPFCTSIINRPDHGFTESKNSGIELLDALVPKATDPASPNPQLVSIDEALRLNDEDESAAITVGETVREVQVRGLLRPFLSKNSKKRPWSKIVLGDSKAPKFSFAEEPEQSAHSVDPTSGLVVAYESRKHEVLGQLEYHQDAERFEKEALQIVCLKISASAMLLLRQCRVVDEESAGVYSRVGISNNYREDFFEDVQAVKLTLV